MTYQELDSDHFGNLMVEFGEDFFYEYDGDEARAFAGFINGGDRVRTEGALRELTRIEAMCTTEEELDTALTEAGLRVSMIEGALPYREFTQRLIGWLTESLADPESQRWDLHPRQ